MRKEKSLKPGNACAQTNVDREKNNNANNGSFFSLSIDKFKKFLQLAVKDVLFIFNDELFKQTNGVAMGSPLGPSLANIFLCHHETKWLNDCP